MKSFIFLCLTTLSSLAFAGFSPDLWMVTGSSPAVSQATKADGSILTIAGESVLSVQLQTARSYGDMYTRQVKSQSVTLPTATQAGRIDLVIETETELMCGDHAPDFSMNTVGEHNARAQVLLKDGTYDMFINGLLAAKVELSGLSSMITPDPNYADKVHAESVQHFSDVFGNITQYGVDTAETKLTLTDLDKGIQADYFMAPKTITQSNGDILTQVERKGTIVLDRAYNLDTDCDGRSTLEYHASKTSEEIVFNVSAKNEATGTLRFSGELSGRTLNFSKIK